MRLVLRTAGEGCVLLAQPLAPDRHPALCKAASRTGQCIGIGCQRLPGIQAPTCGTQAVVAQFVLETTLAGRYHARRCP